MELACLDLLAQRRGVPVAQLLTGNHRTAAAQIQVHALVDNAFTAQQAVARGYTTLKIKVGAKRT